MNWPGKTHALLRIMTGFLFIPHGYQKLFGLGDRGPRDDSLALVAAVIEIVGGLFPDALDGVCVLRHDGNGLFHGALFDGSFPAAPQPRRARRAVLLRVPVPVGQRIGTVVYRRLFEESKGILGSTRAHRANQQRTAESVLEQASRHWPGLRVRHRGGVPRPVRGSSQRPGPAYTPRPSSRRP